MTRNPPWQNRGPRNLVLKGFEWEGWAEKPPQQSDRLKSLVPFFQSHTHGKDLEMKTGTMTALGGNGIINKLVEKSVCRL